MKRICTLLAVATPCLMSATAFAASFPDVPEHHPRYTAIEYVKQLGIVSGYPDGTFRPEQTINRAEFVKILVEAFAEEGTGDGACALSFHDARVEEWYGRSLCRAGALQWIGGYPDGTFRPGNPVNVAEAAKILVSAHEEDDPELAASHGSLWFLNYALILDQLGAWPERLSSFDQPLTRGDMAEMIAKMLFVLREGLRPERTVTTADVFARRGMMIIVGEGWHGAHPSEWGKWVDMEQASDEKFVFGFETLRELGTYPNNDPRFVTVEVLRYDDGDHRYETTCDPCTEGSAMYRRDLLAQKQEIERTADRTVAGLPVHRTDGYSPEGGTLYRQYVLFLPFLRLTITARYFTGDLVETNPGESLTDAMDRLLSGDWSDPVEDTIRLSASAGALRRFMEQADAFVTSLTYHPRGFVTVLPVKRSEEWQDSASSPESATETDARRRADATTILNAIHLYALDHQGGLPAGIAEGTREQPLCRQAHACGGISLDELIGGYLDTIPIDPSAQSGFSGYLLSFIDNRLTIHAPLAETEVIELSRDIE